MAKHKPVKVVVVDVSGKENPFAGSITYEEYVGGGSEEDPDVRRPSGIYSKVTRLYTSGTTAMPKGVPLNNINKIMSAHDVMMHFPLRPTDKTMNTTPWFHRGGLFSGGPNPTLYAGGSLVVLRYFDPKAILAHAARFAGNGRHGRPFLHR